MSHLLISPSLEQLYTSTLLPSGSGHLFSTVNDWWSGILLFIPKFLKPPWSGEQFSCKTRSSSPSKRLQLMSKWWAGGMLGACTMGQLSMWTILVKSSLPSKDLRFIVTCATTYFLLLVILWQLNQEKSIAIYTDVPTSPSAFLCHSPQACQFLFHSTSWISKLYSSLWHCIYTARISCRSGLLGLLCSCYTEGEGDRQE